MSPNLNLSKEEIQFEKKKHLEILSQKDFQVEIPSDYFLSETFEELREKGNWFEALRNR